MNLICILLRSSHGDVLCLVSDILFTTKIKHQPCYSIFADHCTYGLCIFTRGCIFESCETFASEDNPFRTQVPRQRWNWTKHKPDLWVFTAESYVYFNICIRNLSSQRLHLGSRQWYRIFAFGIYTHFWCSYCKVGYICIRFRQWTLQPLDFQL